MNLEAELEKLQKSIDSRRSNTYNNKIIIIAVIVILLVIVVSFFMLSGSDVDDVFSNRSNLKDIKDPKNAIEPAKNQPKIDFFPGGENISVIQTRK